MSIMTARGAALAELARTWWIALEELARIDPDGADVLVRAQWGHLSRYRPESPVPLDAWEPSGTVPSGPPR